MIEDKEITTIPILSSNKNMTTSSIEQSAELDQFFTALSLFQGEVEMPEKNARGNWGTYADITEIVSCIRPTLSKHGLSYMQPPIVRNDNGDLGIITWIGHKSGQWIRSTFILKPEKDSNQGIGGSITYLRRYCLSAALGLATEEDNDGDQVVHTGAPHSGVPRGPKCITEKQAAWLNKLIQEKPQGTLETILNRVGVVGIDHIPIAKFNGILEWLKDN